MDQPAALTVSNNVIYAVMHNDAFITADATYPERLSLIGGCSLDGWLHDIVLYGDYAFVAAGANGIHVVDVSDVANPQLVKSCKFQNAVSLAIEGEKLHVSGGYNGYRIFNVKEPRRPVEELYYKSDHYAFLEQSIVYGDVVCLFYYMGNYGRALLEIIDISDYTSPTRIYQREFDSRFADTAMSGKDLYIYFKSGDLMVIDLTNPTLPQDLYTVSVATGNGIMGHLQVLEDYLVIGSNWDFFMMELYQPGTTPQPQYVHNESNVHLYWHFDASLYTGGKLYAIDATGNLNVYGLSTSPLSFAKLSSFSPFYGRVTVAGIYAYLAAGSGGVVIIDISNIGHPRWCGSWSYPGSVYDVQVEGDRLLVNGDSNYLLDISDRSAPVLLGSVPSGLALLKGNYIYQADLYGNLYVYNMSNPAQPTVHAVHNQNMIATTMKLDAAKNRLFYAGNGALYLGEIDNAGNYTRLNVATFSEVAKTVAWKNDVVYLAVANELRSYEISSSDRLTFQSSRILPSWSLKEMCVVGDYLYLAMGHEGIIEFNVRNGIPDSYGENDMGRYEAHGIADAGNGYLCVGSGGDGMLTMRHAGEYGQWYTATTPVPVPIIWLMQHGLVNFDNEYELAAWADVDGDGFAAWEEYVAQTDPWDPDSFPQALIKVENDTPIIGWKPDLGAARRYTVMGKSELDEATWRIPTNSSHRFFRVKVEMP